MVPGTGLVLEVERPETVFVARPLEDFRMPKRPDGIVEPGTPMIDHAAPREFVILRIPFVLPRSIDQLDDVVGLEVGEFSEELGRGTVAQSLREKIGRASCRERV